MNGQVNRPIITCPWHQAKMKHPPGSPTCFINDVPPIRVVYMPDLIAWTALFITEMGLAMVDMLERVPLEVPGKDADEQPRLFLVDEDDAGQSD